MTFRAPKVSPDGNFRGSLRKYATGVRINATGGWWDAGDYLKFTQTTSYTVAMLLQGIVSFPAQLGGGHRQRLLAVRPGQAERTLRARPSSAWTSCSGCGTRRPGRCTSRSAPVRRTTSTSVTTTSGGCRRPTTITRAPIRTTCTSGTRRSSAPGRQALRSARTWPVAWPPTSRSATAFSAQRPRIRQPLPAIGGNRLRAGRHALEGSPSHGAAI